MFRLQNVPINLPPPPPKERSHAMESSYLLLKFIHVAAAILFLGNLIVTGWWKIMALRRNDPAIAVFAQRYAVKADTWFSGVAVLALFATGFTNALYHYDYHGSFWLFQGGLAFLAMIIVWIGLLIPVEWKLKGLAERFVEEGSISSDYRRWWTWGLVLRGLVILISVGMLYLMIFKPMDSPLG
jgi:uncharacterized membrane protein